MQALTKKAHMNPYTLMKLEYTHMQTHKYMSMDIPTQTCTCTCGQKCIYTDKHAITSWNNLHREVHT